MSASAAAAPRWRAATTRADPLRLVGPGALIVSVAAAAWIAAGAADGPTWIQLPSHTAPAWVLGVLHGVWPLSPEALSAGLLVLGAAYAIALWCAPSIPLRIALAAVVLANLAFTLGPTIVSSDVFGYIAYARELVRGLNPYLSAPAVLGHDAVLPFVYWTHQPSPYGPLFTVLSAPLGLLSPAGALWVYKALAGLAAVTIAWLVARLAPRRGLDPARAAIFVGLNPVLLFYAVSGAHNDLIAVALMTGALALAVTRSERPGGGAAMAVAAAAVKVTVGLALPFVLLLAHRRGRAAGVAGLAVAAVGVAAVALFGTHLFGQVQRITTDARFDIAGSGPDLLARALGTHITTTLRTACTGAAGVVAVAMLVRAWVGADAVAAAGWALAALLASIASLAPWYLVWLLPFAALGRSRGLRITALLATAYLLGAHLPALGGQPWLSAP